MTADEAAEILNYEIIKLLDKYAKKKVIQNRTTYCPAITTETKGKIKYRNRLQFEVYQLKDTSKLADYKLAVKETRNGINNDKKKYV